MVARRRTELGLMVLAALITGIAYVLASLGSSASIPANIGPFLATIFGLLGVAHIAVRRLAPRADPTLLPIAAALNGLGYVMIARLDDQLAALQATWTAVGIVAFVATLVVVSDVRTLAQYRYSLLALGIVLLLLPLAPVIGTEINGARIWVYIGPLSFQPGELAKIVLALFLAAYVVDRRELLAMTSRRIGPLALPDLRHFGPLLLAWGLAMVVMMAEKDLGSSLLFFALFAVVLWVATDRGAYLLVSLVLFSVGAYVAWRLFDHVQVRVEIWLDPWQDVSGKGFQVVQATFALAWGGLTGTGLGVGRPDRVPAATTDFIFAAIGEELGLLGATAVLVAFVLFVGAGLRIALRARTPFETLLATGLTTIVGFQAFIIVAGVTRLVPLTGITLPFVSYGGSSLVANYVLLALLLRISDGANAAAEDAAVDATTVRAGRQP